MPAHNAFRHQSYDSSRVTPPAELLTPDLPTVATTDFDLRMAAVGRSLRAADVRAIYLVHGSFVGPDALGLVREVSRVSVKAARPLRQLLKQAVDKIATDAGNFTSEYAARFEQAIAVDDGSSIPVRLFNWSSENHHIGRADGAIRLLHELGSHDAHAGGRVLLWGHSHGGNVFALLTNLLGADSAGRRLFFRAARSYYRWPLIHRVDMPVWKDVRKLLADSASLLRQTRLDLVTMGTPVRYGWDSGGYEHLLHFVNHRPAEGAAPECTQLPRDIDDLKTGLHGDYAQHLAIAGTNIAPTIWAWRAWLADIRLGRLLQAGVRRRDLIRRLKRGIRAHEDGQTLLVDYGPPHDSLARHMLGHAVYTTSSWLLFHAEQVARRFYGLQCPP